MLESTYQARLIKKLRSLFPGCIILKNDANYLQGVPDLTILWGRRWAMLEVKVNEDYQLEPNQQYYVQLAHEMSFSAIITPFNEPEVLYELQLAFQPCECPRLT